MARIPRSVATIERTRPEPHEPFAYLPDYTFLRRLSVRRQQPEIPANSLETQLKKLASLADKANNVLAGKSSPRPGGQPCASFESANFDSAS